MNNFADKYPNHCKTSCSDDSPINFSFDGTGCCRCSALIVDSLVYALIEARDALNGAPNTVGLHNQINSAISKTGWAE